MAVGLMSIFFGALLQRSHFCTMGAVSDIVVMSDWTRMRQWVLAIAVAILGFGCMTFAGWITPLKTIYATPSAMWLSAIVGGGLFGWGMVLGSGCGSKSWVRLGSGNLKSLVVLMVMAISALAAMKGLLALPRVLWLESVRLDPGPGVFASQWLALATGWALPQAALAASLAIGLALLAWVLSERSFITQHNMLTGTLVGLCVCVFWWISGVWGHGLEHPQTLDEFFLATASNRLESFSFTGPTAHALDALLYFSDGSKRWTVGLVSVFGVAVGAGISALMNGSFRWEGFTSRADMSRHMWGGACMGVGAVVAMGCSIGQGLSGLSTLNAVSLLATLSIIGGAVLALRQQMRALERQA